MRRSPRRPRAGLARTRKAPSRLWLVAASLANRSRAFSDTRNSGACRCASMPRRWCQDQKQKLSSRLRSRQSIPAARARGNCASPTSAPAAARSFWHCCPNCRTPSASVPTRVRRRSWWRVTMPAVLPCRGQGSSPAIWPRRCADRFDAIVSNPPYIASGDIAALAPDVRDFDPHLALDGGTDGLSFYRAIAAAVPTLLMPGGVLVVELGIGQAEPVAHLFAAAGLAPSPPHPDLTVRHAPSLQRKRA